MQMEHPPRDPALTAVLHAALQAPDEMAEAERAAMKLPKLLCLQRTPELLAQHMVSTLGHNGEALRYLGEMRESLNRVLDLLVSHVQDETYQDHLLKRKQP